MKSGIQSRYLICTVLYMELFFTIWCTTYRLTITLQRGIVICMVVLFLIQTYRALDKYLKKDTMMLTELEELEQQIFPSVTICKHHMLDRRNESTEEDLEYNSVLENWLKFEFDSKE